jgi:hypothetical protein
MKASTGAGGPTAAVLFLALALPAAAAAQTAPAAAMNDQWHFVAAPYMWFTGINGDVTVADQLVVPIDTSFSEIWENLDIALQGHFEARKNRMGLGVDVIWVNLGAPLAVRVPGEVTVDVRQLVAEGFGFYRVLAGGGEENPSHLDAVVGVRYTGFRTRLVLERDGEGGETDFREQSWVDLLGGFKFRVPLGSRFAILGRTDLAFLGSNLTWNLEGDVAFRASYHWGVGLGWRHLDIDYDNGDERPSKVFDVAYDGPRAWFSYSW